jgi:hypothetical protein
MWLHTRVHAFHEQGPQPQTGSNALREDWYELARNSVSWFCIRIHSTRPYLQSYYWLFRKRSLTTFCTSTKIFAHRRMYIHSCHLLIKSVTVTTKSMLGTLLLVFVLVGLGYVMLYHVTTRFSSFCDSHWYSLCFVVSVSLSLSFCLSCCSHFGT